MTPSIDDGDTACSEDSTYALVKPDLDQGYPTCTPADEQELVQRMRSEVVSAFDCAPCTMGGSESLTCGGYLHYSAYCSGGSECAAYRTRNSHHFAYSYFGCLTHYQPRNAFQVFEAHRCLEECEFDDVAMLALDLSTIDDDGYGRRWWCKCSSSRDIELLQPVLTQGCEVSLS
jgi:hypothetical protein